MTAKTLVSVVGPTAIGKTKLSVAIAKHFDTEIISADSRQFYREMSIGTAVPSKRELAEVPPHFIQHKSIHEPYTVGDFERDVLETLDQLFKDRNIAVLVGGSGLYVEAVTSGLDYFPKVEERVRLQLSKAYEEDGIEVLQEKLRELDPDYSQKVDLANPHRLIRALEVCISSGVPYSSFLDKRKPQRPFRVITVGLRADRTVVYERINRRVDEMMKQGMLEEAWSLLPYRKLNALQTVGYKELFSHLEGDWDLEFAVSEIKKNTRRFAKRQITWFKKDPMIHWINYEVHPEKVIDLIKKDLKT
jgi:tRNA dimethylallyltransferase